MDSTQDIALAWAIAGLALMLAELIIPGLVVVFFGAAALLTAALIYVGLVQGWAAILTTWFVSSVAFVLLIRSTLSRFVGGDTTRGNPDADEDAVGRRVEVLRRVTADDDQGEIFHSGTVWRARSVGPEIPQGAKAVLVRRELLVWIVAPVPASETHIHPPRAD